MGVSGICFFFQAEDGIRDIGVTGVQTCALPILPDPLPSIYFGGASAAAEGVAARVADVCLTWGEPPAMLRERLERMRERSEERRVGKEGRSRWSPYH